MKFGNHTKPNDPKIISHISPISPAIVSFTQLKANMHPPKSEYSFVSNINLVPDLVIKETLVYRMNYILRNSNNVSYLGEHLWVD